MTSKFKKQRKRQQWSESILHPPIEFLSKVEALGPEKPFVDAAMEYIKSSSVYSRMKIFPRLLSIVKAEKMDEQLIDICMELMLVESEKQLHKIMISSFVQFPIDINAKLTALLLKHVELSKNAPLASRKSSLVTFLITLSENDKLSDCLKDCGIDMCIFLCERMGSMLGVDHNKSNSSLPWQLEECQDSISIVYSILSRFSHFLLDKDTSQMIKCVALVSKTMFWILQNDVVVREALPSAGVALWKAITLPECTPTLEAELLIKAYSIPPAISVNQSDRTLSFLFMQQQLENDGSNLLTEVHKFSEFGRVCSLRGVLSILGLETLTQSQINRDCVLKNTLRCLCGELSNSNDVNFCFHALCAMSTALERFKTYFTSLLKNTIPSSDSIEDEKQEIDDVGVMEGMLLLKEDFEFVFGALWRHVDDTVVQTERQAISVFNLLMEVIELQPKVYTQTTQQILTNDTALLLILNRISNLGVQKKGKYVLLSSIATKYGALAMIKESSLLINSILSSFSEGSVCRAAGNCLFSLIKALKFEILDDHWTEYWLESLLEYLKSTDEVLQSNLITYFLPQLIKFDNEAFTTILKSLMGTDHHTPNALIAAVSVLRIARQEAIISDLQSILDGSSEVSASVLMYSIRHESEALHVSTLELACIHPKPSDFPGEIDYQIVKEAFLVRSRRVSHGARAKWISLFEKFLIRLHVAVKACKSHSCRKQLTLETEKGDLVKSRSFLKWLLIRLVYGLYPGGCSERRIISMELLAILHRIWKVEELPYSDLSGTLTVQQVSLIVIGCILDPWDYMRSKTMECLEFLPTPLPGFTTPDELRPVLDWSCHLISSPRLRDNDAGARLLVLLFKKYTVFMNWRIILKPVLEISVIAEQDPRIEFIDSLFTWFKTLIEEAKDNLLETCKKGLTHGVLLALRYTIDAIDWRSAINSIQNSSILRSMLDSFFSTAEVCSSLCLSVLSNHDVNLGAEDEGDALDEILGPHAQLLVTGTWLSIKELSVVLATIIQNIPFISKQSSHHLSLDEVLYLDAEPGLLDLEDCERLGRYYLKTLTDLKHNGAVEKTGFSFQVVCECLLLNPDQRFHRLPETWMEYFFDRIKQSDQSWNDIIRRSGGVPYGITAIFQAEPKTSPKVLLPHGLKTLLIISNEKQNFEPWTRVHVFHIMRHIFNDKQLALDGANCISDGFMMCVCALSDDNWEVRNAASLCFATFLTRMVGYKNKIGSGASQKPISIFEFFFRYPDLLDFLLKEMKDAGEVLQDARSPVPPSLGPILLLLARLVPAVQAPVMTKAMSDPTVLIPVIQKCLEVPHFAVRRLAADALVTLIFKEKVIEYIHQILSNLDPTSNNSLHGKVLAVQRLLTVHKDLQNEVIQSDLLDKLKGLLWLLSHRGIAGSVKMEFISILREDDWMLEQDPELKTKILETVYRLLFGDPVDLQEDPTYILFLKSCVWFVFQNELPSRSKVEILLGHLVYEVRLETLKLIVQKLRQGTVSQTQVSWMQCLLLDQLRESTIPKAKSKCLEGLFELFKLNQGNLDITSNWTILFESYTNGNLLKIREHSLLYMGCMIRKLVEDEQSLDQNIKVLQSFLESVIDSSRYSAPLSTRLTAAQSLQSLQLFQVHPFNKSDNICAILLKYWELLFHFLEDEDTNIQQTSSAILESLQGKTVVPTLHISLILKDFFRLLRDRFQSKKGYASLLIDWIVDYKAITLKDVSLESSSRLFDKEEDNRHEEILLRSQLAASALLGTQIDQFLVHEQLQRLLEQLEQHIAFLRDSESQASWPEMTTHKADAFITSYRMLLGVWILLRNGIIEDSWRNCVSSLLKILDELQLHPLLKCVIEKVKGAVSGSFVAGCDGFEDSWKDSDLLFLV